MLLAGPILRRLAGIILPQFLHGWRHTVSRSVFQSLDELIPAHRQSVSGALTPEKFWMNLRYQPAVPKKLRSCRVFLGTSIFIIASTFFGSVRKAPSPIMNPKYPTCSVLRKSWISSASHPSIQRRGCEDAVGLPCPLPYTTFEPNYITRMASVETDTVAFQNACFKSILLMKIVSSTRLKIDSMFCSGFLYQCRSVVPGTFTYLDDS
ncbi:uncharacterized protein [Drosophila suzukii]|uniref:Uncharacterized protein isoform X1 n=2 Tax=Drosophila suzukii TaxID=28584 RepID=A0ABM4TLT6_DROSZ